jgi:hypothetical protein
MINALSSMAKLTLPLILGKLLLKITGNARKLCQNGKLFSRLTITPLLQN